MVVDKARSVKPVLPVDALYPVEIEVSQVSVRIGEHVIHRVQLVHHGSISLEIEHFQFARKHLHADIAVVLDASRRAAALLRGDHDDTVGTPVSVYGRGGCVFQHFYGGYILRIYHGKSAHL